MSKGQQLIEQTLSGVRVTTVSHFLSNEAGSELKKDAEQYVEDIEKALRQFSGPDERFRRSPDDIWMEYVMIAYLVGSVRRSRSESFVFLKTLPDEWIYDAVACASTAFWVNRFGYSNGVAPNSDMKDFLEWGKQSQNKKIAQWLQSKGITGDIRLISCYSGKLDTGGVAQNLSNKLGVKVMAPTDAIVVNSNGLLTAPIGTVWKILSPGG